MHKLWVGLVLVGVLGVQQTPVEAQVSLQSNFQLDKVRPSPRRNRALSEDGVPSAQDLSPWEAGSWAGGAG